ncbi:MAG: hypothetical protein Kow0069_37350 [Promethearchaeota archaeon]
MIRHFLVMLQTGELLFSVSMPPHEEEFEVNLVSSFVAAVYSFVQHALRTEEIHDLDVGKFRFLFDREVVGDQVVLFIAIAGRGTPITEMRPKLSDLKWDFMMRFRSLLKEGYKGEVEAFEEFTEPARVILRSRKIIVDGDLERRMLTLFQKLAATTEFATGAALLDTDGRVLFSFLDEQTLESVVKTLEGRFIAGIRMIREVISIEEEGILFLIGGQRLIVAVLFRPGTPLGTAQLRAQRIFSAFDSLLTN